MEVHAHSHTERKKWSHYFWEFLMLFLAVTLWFFCRKPAGALYRASNEKNSMLPSCTAT